MGSYLSKELAKIARAKESYRKEINEPINLNVRHAEHLNELVISFQRYGKDFKYLYLLLKQTFPSGFVHREQFLELFASIFPHAVSLAFAHRMFDIFAAQDEQQVQLVKIMAALSKLYYGTIEDKIQWIFQFYDCNNDNYLNESDVLNTVTSIYALNGLDANTDSTRDLICRQTKRLLSDFGAREKEEIDEEQFSACCMQNTKLLSAISALDQLIH
uniref:EF-hand domain-containing protein n=1 Tax=Trichuris muris TaxID=70415 RepID=A0A5S6PZH0_TRIMR